MLFGGKSCLAVQTVLATHVPVLYCYSMLLLLQLLANLALALRDLEQLADMALVTGCNTSITADSLTTNENSAAKDVEAQTADAAAAAAGFTGPATAATAGKAAKASKKAAATTPTSLAVSLAADANHKLQLVQQLLAMTAKERYMGTVGGYRYKDAADAGYKLGFACDAHSELLRRIAADTGL